MKVKEFISNCIDEIGSIIREKEFELDQLNRNVEEKQKQIYLLELKQNIYRAYLKNERRFKEDEN